jgi:hypothetical protein
VEPATPTGSPTASRPRTWCATPAVWQAGPLHRFLVMDGHGNGNWLQDLPTFDYMQYLNQGLSANTPWTYRVAPDIRSPPLRTPAGPRCCSPITARRGPVCSTTCVSSMSRPGSMFRCRTASSIRLPPTTIRPCGPSASGRSTPAAAEPWRATPTSGRPWFWVRPASRSGPVGGKLRVPGQWPHVRL